MKKFFLVRIRLVDCTRWVNYLRQEHVEIEDLGIWAPVVLRRWVVEGILVHHQLHRLTTWVKLMIKL